MVSRRLALLLALLLSSTAALAGCFGKDEEPTATLDTNETPQVEPNATLPDDRGEAIAFQETNKTEEGLGGIDHKHDYWSGQTRVDVFQDDVYFDTYPLYPEGEGSSPKSVAYIKLPQPALIYEGASSVEILVSAVDFGEATDGVLIPHPVPPALQLSYRTASGDGFQDGGALTVGTPLILPVSAKETDMPHSVSSLWAFRIMADSRQDLARMNLTITAVKGANVVDWPGHPEFYAETDQRVVLDKDYKVHRDGVDEFALYGSQSTWVRPDKLISYGTGRLDVFINITSVTSSNGAQPTGFFLEYHNATILDEEDEFNDRIDDEEKGRQFDHKDYHFVVNVDPAGMDGPYQPASRWGFRPVATFAETPVASLCPGCFAYDIEYHITVIAHKASDEQARLNG